MPIWIWLPGLYLVGLVINFLLIVFFDQPTVDRWLSDEDDYFSSSSPAVEPITFQQKCWLELQDLGKLKENWVELVGLLLWPLIWAILIVLVIIALLLGLSFKLGDLLKSKLLASEH